MGGHGYHRFLIRGDYAELAVEACHFVRLFPRGAPDAEAVAVREAEAFVCRVLHGRDGFCLDLRSIRRGPAGGLRGGPRLEEAAEAGQFGRPQVESALRYRVAEGAGVPLGVVDGQRGEEAGQQVVADVGAGRGAQGAGRTYGPMPVYLKYVPGSCASGVAKKSAARSGTTTGSPSHQECGLPDVIMSKCRSVTWSRPGAAEPASSG